MATLVSTAIQRDNSNNITYVLKKYNDGTVTIFTYMLIKGCYRLIGKNTRP